MGSVLRRRRWIIRRKLDGWRSRDIATALHINERTVYRWWSLYRKQGWEGLTIKSKAPHKHYETPKETVNYIIELRSERHWGPNKIEGYLCNYRPEGTIPISHRTIHRILVKAGLNHPITAPRKVWGKRRFERPYSNNLWQADFKMTDLDRPGNPVPSSQRRPLRIHRVLQWKRHTTHHGEYTTPINNRQNRSLPQSLRPRSLDVSEPQRIHPLLELSTTPSGNRLSISSRHILQRPEQTDRCG